MNCELLSKEDVAKRLGISVQTVHRLIKQGKLHTVKVGSRFVRIEAEEVETYLSNAKKGTFHV